MFKKNFFVLFFLMLTIPAFAMGGSPPQDEKGGNMSNNPQVIMETSKGKMVIELYPDKAPITVANFLAYVDSGFFEGTIFHRVIPGFMIQGGGFGKGLTEKLTNAPIKNEAGNGVKNERGTLAMARTNVVDSATAQFFVNVADNGFLDQRDKTSAGFGYCVFGKVTEGMPVADAIVSVKRHSVGYYDDVPVEDVIITSIKRK